MPSRWGIPRMFAPGRSGLRLAPRCRGDGARGKYWARRSDLAADERPGAVSECRCQFPEAEPLDPPA